MMGGQQGEEVRQPRFRRGCDHGVTFLIIAEKTTFDPGSGGRRAATLG